MKLAKTMATPAVVTSITRIGRGRAWYQALAVAIAVCRARGMAIGGVGSDTGPPELLECVEDLRADGSDQLESDVGFLHRDHRAVQVVDRAGRQGVDLLAGGEVEAVRLI